MITIQTVLSRIQHIDGSLADGKLSVNPTAPFEYILGGSGIKVTQNVVSVDIVAGQLVAPLLLSPCQGPTHQPARVLYQATYRFKHVSETQLWILDTDFAVYEATDVPMVAQQPLPVYTILATPPNFADAETPAGVVNGTDRTDGNAVFTLAHSPNPVASLRLYRTSSGQLLTQGQDFDLTGNTITFRSGAIPAVGDTFLAWYRY